LARNIRKKLDTNYFNFGHLTFNTVATLPCEMQIIEPAVGELCQRLQHAFVLEEDILAHAVITMI